MPEYIANVGVSHIPLSHMHSGTKASWIYFTRLVNVQWVQINYTLQEKLTQMGIGIFKKTCFIALYFKEMQLK